MNRTLLLLVATLVLGLLAWWATSTSGPETVRSDRDFAVERAEDVHRIFIADRLGNRAELSRRGGGWWYNDSLPANENAMDNLLQAVTQLEVRSLPARAAIPNMVKNLATGGILVQVFDRRGDKLRGYYVGGGTQGEHGTLAIMEGSENPYVVHLPQWTGNVRHRFNLRGDDWRSKRIFAADPDRVERLSIEYPRQRDRSFVLERAGGKYQLGPLYETGQPVRDVPRGVAERVLSRFERYFVSRYENRDTASIRAARDRLPFAVIRLRETGRPEQTVRLYPRFRDPAYANDAKTGEVLDLAGLVAYTGFVNDGRDWALMAVETTQPLLVGYESF